MKIRHIKIQVGQAHSKSCGLGSSPRLLSSSVWDLRKIRFGARGIRNCICHIKFEVTIRHLGGDPEKVSGYIQLELKRETRMETQI